jgi:uncharacterized protein DUF1549/uncharacterized protein DUF1553
MNRCIQFRAVAVTAFLVAAAGLIGAGQAADKPGQKAVAKLSTAALSQRIDEVILQRLTAEKVPASPLADDAEFLRRVYLDITGVIPTAEQAKKFLDSKDPDKRAKLIDELLASLGFGRHMADIWSDLIIPKSSENQRLQPAPLTDWLEKQFNENKPWDKLVYDLLTSSGPQDENGAVTFFLANPTADKMNDVATRLFMGVQLQCAQCHNHPFTKWKQDEYWGMAMFFTKVRPDNLRQAQKNGNTPSITEGGGRPNNKQKLPESAKMVPPKFLQGEQPKVNDKEPYRPILAKWMTASENPFFAKAMVNRVWSQFFGRGFVNAVDDMHEKNQASHPELLDELSAQFVASGFDVKHLVRTICNSQTYQRTSRPLAGNEEDVALFSHVAVRTLTPEQLFDSLEAVVGKTQQQRGAGRQAGGKGVPRSPRAQFVAFFETDDGADPTEYGAGIPQALRLMNSAQLNNGGALLNQAAKAGAKPADVIETLYLATLSRRPNEAETNRLVARVDAAGKESRKVYSDILWALLNSSEFTLNH